MTPTRLKWFALAIIVLCFLVANVIATHQLLTEPYPGHNDFMSRWEGARSFFIDGLNPYGEEASLNIQQRIYGRPVIDNEDPGYFAYPFYTAFIVAPTVLVDYAWASAIWMVFLEVCLIGALALLLHLFRWQPSPLVLTALILYALFDYYASRGLLLGQPGHVVYVLQIFAIWALYRGHNATAGVALAISTLKPQMGYLLVPFLLLWALRAKRWRFVAGFGVSFAVLMGASFVLEPSWFTDWIAQVRAYPVYTIAAYPDTGSPVWIIVQHYLGAGDLAEWIISGLVALPVLWAWFQVLVRGRDERFLWAIMLTLLLTHLIALRTATPHFVVFNLAIVFYLKQLHQRSGALPVIGVIFGLMVISWALFLMTIPGRTHEHPLLFLPLPIALYIVVIFTRRLWWQRAPELHT